MITAAVMGAGNWGTAFAALLADAGTAVRLWARRPELAQHMASHRENADYLPGVQLPDGVTATADVAAALSGADFVVLSIPSHAMRDTVTGFAGQLPKDALLVSLSKGVEAGTCKRMSQVIAEVMGADPARVMALSGPNLSHEIAARQPAAAVIACIRENNARKLQAACATSYFRPYTHTDVVGVELGGAVKNVIAIAVGLAEGLGLGDNARASLLTRGLAETARLGVALGADPMTFAGLAGLGDLVATCASPLSRNRSLGEQLGRGRTLAEVQAGTRMVAEGVRSSVSVLELARRHKVEMPLTERVVAVLHEGVAPDDVVRSLMAREPKSERPSW